MEGQELRGCRIEQWQARSPEQIEVVLLFPSGARRPLMFAVRQVGDTWRVAGKFMGPARPPQAPPPDRE